MGLTNNLYDRLKDKNSVFGKKEVFVEKNVRLSDAVAFQEELEDYESGKRTPPRRLPPGTPIDSKVEDLIRRVLRVRLKDRDYTLKDIGRRIKRVNKFRHVYDAGVHHVPNYERLRIPGLHDHIAPYHPRRHEVWLEDEGISEIEQEAKNVLRFDPGRRQKEFEAQPLDDVPKPPEGELGAKGEGEKGKTKRKKTEEEPE